MENKITFTSWEIIKMAGQSLLFGIAIPITTFINILSTSLHFQTCLCIAKRNAL